MKAARLTMLAAEIEAQRERIHAEFDCHKAALLADAALDARRLGYAVTVVEAACRGIDTAGSLAAWERMTAAGVCRG